MPKPPPAPTLGEPWWHSLQPADPAPALTEDARCDVVVIGGGVAGLSAALRLSAAGADVILLERGVCGGGTSGRSSGFLTPDSELGLHALVGRFGEADAAALWRLGADGAALIDATARAAPFECDLQAVDCLFVGIGEAGATTIREEAAARAACGFDVELLDAAATAAVHPGGYEAALTYSNTLTMNPYAWCRGAAALLRERGLRIYEDSPVEQILDGAVRTGRGTVHAAATIVCADQVPRSLNPRASTQIYHAQTFLAVSERLSDAQVRHLFPSRRFQVWDTTNVYSYYRLTGDGRLLLGGGSPWTTFSRHLLRSPRVIRAVIRGFRDRFPGLASLRFVRWWPGLIDITRDLLPIVAADPDQPTVQYVIGSAGLPWAAWGGDHAARRLLDPATEDMSRFFGWGRPAFVPDAAQAILGKPISFALDALESRRAPENGGGTVG